MFDVKAIRDDPAVFDAGRAKRGLDPLAADVLALDDARRVLQTRLQEMQKRRNEASKAIGQAKAKGGDGADLMAEVAALKDDIRAVEDDERAAAAKLETVLSAEPNLPEDAVPAGVDESANIELRKIGEPRRFNFEARDHVDIGEGLGLMDFEIAARMSGARFVVLTGALSRLERALAAFMLDIHTREFGYTEVSPPLLVRDFAAFGTGNLPKFADDLFVTFSARDQDRFWADYDAARDAQFEEFGRTQETQEERRRKSLMRQREWHGRFQSDEYARPLWLIPTAEMVLTNLAAGRIIDADRLPLRYTAYTPCFRSEAGAAGKDTRGMIRQHQFTKVELVSITHPDQSDAEHERMTECAQAVLERLELPYRVVILAAGDMSFAAQKTYDIEVWLPGQDAYREISSCSNCTDFQARRMKARFRSEGEKGTRHVHTLNGSALAVGRTLIAVLENHQEADGSVTIPEALRPYMDGLERIEPVD
ncbi:MAG: serine--tRNA ligase [Alphaproteobacteria bacterium]